MATKIHKPTTQIYKEVNKGKYRSVKHFDLVEVATGTPQLSNKINISKNRNCALSMPDYWLKIRQGNKWSNCITGLFKTDTPNIYKGDQNHKQNLLLFKFSSDDTLVIYYFKNYYTNDLSKVLPFINE